LSVADYFLTDNSKSRFAGWIY